jgi:hypothetical protein
MLRLEFEGFFQCRLATDPDPADETRGVSAWTFAVAPEPDLDRIIRLQDPVAFRSQGPTVGVHVVRAVIDDQPSGDHPLLGARVDLRDAPRFEGRSGIVAEDTREMIDPFLLEVSGRGVTLRREDFWDASVPERPSIIDVSPELLVRRQPNRQAAARPGEVFTALGVVTAPAFFERRQECLQQELADTQDPDRHAGLESRIDHITEVLENVQQGRGDIRLNMLGTSLGYRFEINGPGAVVDDPAGLLRDTIDTSLPWPIQFWMGGFDGDSLCAYMRGSLTLPSPGQPNHAPTSDMGGRSK